MKNEIISILKDYVDEFKYYYKIIRKKIKKHIRKLKYMWNNPKNKYVEYIVNKINLVIENIKKLIYKISIIVKNLYFSLKEYLLIDKNRKRNLTVIGVIILVNIISLAVFLSFKSYAIYKDEFEYSVIGAKIGDKYTNQFDYSLLVYIENTNNLGEGNGTYNLISDIPVMGFTYSGYKCKNNSTLVYDEQTKTTSVTTNSKDICSIYFDLTNDSDVVLKIMVEDNVNSNNYVVANKIPYFGYKYSHYECENNSTLVYNSELHSASISSNEKEYCSVYFQKENIDVEITLYVEQNYGNKDYIERKNIPSNIEYKLNETNSVCINNNNERVDSSITYVDGYVELSSTELSNCKVYLDRKNA